MPTMTPSEMSYVPEYVRCKKAGCKKCPHGPYWYGYQWVDGKRKKTYFGRIDPRSPGVFNTSQAERTERVLREEQERRRIQELCFALGVTVAAPRETVRKRMFYLRKRAKQRGATEQQQLERYEMMWRDLCRLKQWV